jgi:hypothetical protein
MTEEEIKNYTPRDSNKLCVCSNQKNDQEDNRILKEYSKPSYLSVVEEHKLLLKTIQKEHCEDKRVIQYLLKELGDYKMKTAALEELIKKVCE